MGETVTAAQDILTTVHLSSQKHGLEISKEKTKVLLIYKEARDVTIHVENQQLEQVIHFKYIGTESTQQKCSSTDIQCRTAQALVAARNLNIIWRNEGISLKTKLRLQDCLIIPIALYGCETWTLNKADTNKLQTFGMKYIRKILNISWQDHITNLNTVTRASRNEK